MDRSYRIPGQSTQNSSRAGGSLPAPGSVIMANVEEDLGEGLYALRWAGQRIAVASHVFLKRGQSLILRSEKSPEGKSLLVVQGPALPEKNVTGRVIYGPGTNIGTRNQGIGNSPNSNANAAQAQADDGMGGQGGPIAAGTIRAGQTHMPGPVRELVGSILEPLADSEMTVEELLKAAEEEKERLQEEKEERQQQQQEQKAEEKKAVKRAVQEALITGRGTEKPGAVVVQSKTGPVVVTPAATGEPVVVPTAPSAPGAATGPAAPPQPAQPGQPPVVVQTPPAGTPVTPPPVIVTTMTDSAGTPVPTPPVATATPPPGQAAPPAQVVITLAGDVATVPDDGVPVPTPLPAPAPATNRTPTAPASPTVTNTVPTGTPQTPTQQPSPTPSTQVPTTTTPSSAATSPPPVATAPAATPLSSRQPELYSKEALTQMMRSSELPIDSATRSLGAVGAMPDSVVDKAAAILLRAAGLTPDSLAMDAARALVRNNQPVDRETVQALTSVAGGLPPDEQDAVIRAAARLAGKDIPISPPLVSGLADVLDRRSSVSTLMHQARVALEPLPGEAKLPAEIKPLMSSAGDLIDLLHVDLDSADAPQALERYVSTFGREALGRTMALVEKAAAVALESNPSLQKIDAALTEIFSLLGDDMAAAQEGESAPAATTAQPKDGGQAAPAPVPTGTTAQSPTPAAPAPGGQPVSPPATAPDAPSPQTSQPAGPVPQPVQSQPVQPPPAVPVPVPAPSGQTAAPPAATVPVAPPPVPPAGGATILPADVGKTVPDLPVRDVIPQMEVVQERPVQSDSAPSVRPSGSAAVATADLSPEMKQAAELLNAIAKNAAAAPSAATGRTPPTSASGDTAPATAQGEPRPDAAAPEPAPTEPPRRPAPINAYLNAPKAFNIAEALRNLPPMPKVVRLDTPPAEIAPPLDGKQIAQTILENLPPGITIPGLSTPGAPPAPVMPEIPVVPIPGQVLPDGTLPPGLAGPGQGGQPPLVTGDGQPVPGAGDRLMNALPDHLLLDGESGVLNKLDSLFQIPGLNRPETDLLRPSGFLDRYLGAQSQEADAARIKSEADALFRQLTSETRIMSRKPWKN